MSLVVETKLRKMMAAKVALHPKMRAKMVMKSTMRTMRDEDEMSFTQAEGSLAGSDLGEKIITRKVSAVVVPNGTAEKKEVNPASLSADFPGPAIHAPTDCSDQETHYDKIIADEIIHAPLGKV